MKKELCFYFIRHGSTSWNEQGLMQGKEGGLLTKQGIASAKLTGFALKDVPFIAAYSSCLARAIDTAQYILEKRDIPFFQHIGLDEHYFGCWEGVATKDLQIQIEFQQLQYEPANYKALISGGETYEELGKRAVQAVRDIIKIHSEGNILIVSHSHTLRLLLGLFNGATWQTHREKENNLEPQNTSISVVRYSQQENEIQGSFILEKINDISHLK